VAYQAINGVMASAKVMAASWRSLGSESAIGNISGNERQRKINKRQQRQQTKISRSKTGGVSAAAMRRQQQRISNGKQHGSGCGVSAAKWRWRVSIAAQCA